MEGAFLQFEVKVVIFCDLEYVGDSLYVGCEGWLLVSINVVGNGNVVHVDSNSSALQVMLRNDGAVDVIHEGLECCW
jgi:hypothetical protein